MDATGFVYLGARYYEPTSGRFLSADPAGHAASMSLYDYVGGDPINRLDPDGRFDGAVAPYDPATMLTRPAPSSSNGPLLSPRAAYIAKGAWTMTAGAVSVAGGIIVVSKAPHVGVPLILGGVIAFDLGMTKFVSGVAGRLPKDPIPQSIGELAALASGNEKAGMAVDLTLVFIDPNLARWPKGIADVIGKIDSGLTLYDASKMISGSKNSANEPIEKKGCPQMSK